MSTDLTISEKNISIVAEWKKIEVRNEQQYNDATIKIAMCRDLMDKIEEYWKPQIQSAYKTHKELCKKRDEMLKPVKEAINAIQIAVNKYTASRKAIESKKVVEGVKTVVVDKYIVEVTNLKELLQEIIAGNLPEDCVIPNMKKLNEIATITQKVAGCKVVKTQETIVKRG